MPHGVSITGSDQDSAEEALNRLLDALRTFGFAGRVTVDDATHIGGTQRTDIEVPSKD